MSSSENIFGDVIYSYTREQAIADGELVDVTDAEGGAREAGFKFPTALTRALWNRIEAIPTSREGIESITGRLWDVCYMSMCAAKRVRDQSTSNVYAQLLMGAKGDRKRKITILINVGPGDNAEPVITIGFPEDF